MMDDVFKEALRPFAPKDSEASPAHTPLPWDIANPHEDIPYIAAGGWPLGKNICCLDGTDGKANAALIVKAVNSHDALVKALVEINSQAVCAVIATDSECFHMLQNCAEISAAALAKAGESSQ